MGWPPLRVFLSSVAADSSSHGSSSRPFMHVFNTSEAGNCDPQQRLALHGDVLRAGPLFEFSSAADSSSDGSSSRTLMHIFNASEACICDPQQRLALHGDVLRAGPSSSFLLQQQTAALRVRRHELSCIYLMPARHAIVTRSSG
jgi:hypothetical protein